jgi:major membrane immunogen (membrane-anchored lipoprotein)
MRLVRVIAAACLLAACGSSSGSWDAGQFRSAAEQQIRRDNGAHEVICETPARTDPGWTFACRAPYTAANGNAAWNDYDVKIVGKSTFEVAPAGSGGG